MKQNRMVTELEIRECATLDEYAECVQIQREVFEMPESELSPVRHFVVTKNAGGWTLGAFDGERLAGFVLSVPAFVNGQTTYYSHMTGVRADYQSHGVGAKLKWAQRERSLSEGVKCIRWTFEPVKARNAYFNLEKLGARVREFRENFYGTDYAAAPLGLDSDRLFAEWHLEDPKVLALAAGEDFPEFGKPAASIQIMNDWTDLVATDPARARAEQLRIRDEFKTAFGFGMVCRSFWRDEEQPAFLLFRD